MQFWPLATTFTSLTVTWDAVTLTVARYVQAAEHRPGLATATNPRWS